MLAASKEFIPLTHEIKNGTFPLLIKNFWARFQCNGFLNITSRFRHKESLKMRKPLKHPLLFIKETITWTTVFLCGISYIHFTFAAQWFSKEASPKINDFKDLTLNDMAASAVKRQPGYKNVLEVYVSNENTFTRVTMKRSDSSPLADCMLKTIFRWSRWRVVFRCLNFSLEVIY